MVFRIETTTRAILIALIASFSLAAQSGTYEVRHRHLRGGAKATLRITENSIAFSEEDRSNGDSCTWSYDDIQRLVLSPDTLRVTTYEDRRGQLGRDRVYVFDRLPLELPGNTYRLLADRLDERFVAAFADNQVTPQWRIPAKLMHGRQGAQGQLLFGTDKIVFRTSEPERSRTWRMTDVENVARNGVFDLTIATHERDFRFQLKQSLPEARYRELWLRISLRHGLQILSSPVVASGAPDERSHSTGEHR